MKVNKRSVSSSYATASRSYGQTKKVAEAAPVAQSDAVEMSGTGSLMQAAAEAVKNVPDVRTEAVAPIQKEFAEGSYHRDEYEVAEKIIEDQLTNSPNP